MQSSLKAKSNDPFGEFNIIEEQEPAVPKGFLDTTVSPGVGQSNLKDPWLLVAPAWAEHPKYSLFLCLFLEWVGWHCMQMIK